MALLRPIETIESRLSDIPIQSGQLIFCTDTNDIYMDNSEHDRVHMTDIIKLKTEDDRRSIFVPLIGKIYLVEESNILYTHNGMDWETISMDICVDIEDIPYNQLIPGILQKKGQVYAPRTLGSVVYMEDGKTLNETITELKKLAVRPILTTLRKTVKITTDTNTVPISIDGFDKNTDTLLVYINSTYIEEVEDYRVVDNSNIEKVEGLWYGTQDETIFNFVVVKLTNPQTLSVDNLKSNEIEVTELVKKIDKYESTIELLLKKVSDLESRLNNE